MTETLNPIAIHCWALADGKISEVDAFQEGVYWHVPKLQCKFLGRDMLYDTKAEVLEAAIQQAKALKEQLEFELGEAQQELEALLIEALTIKYG